MEAGNRTILVIRHGEKPGTTSVPCEFTKKTPEGVTVEGDKNDHSLLVCGWQRAGALAALFAPQVGLPREGLLPPGQLVAPKYRDPEKMFDERTHETIRPLSQVTGVEVEAPYEEGEEAKLAGWLVEAVGGVALVCWEHHHIPAIGNAIPTVPGTGIPSQWPDERFDMVWSFTRQLEPRLYVFEQIPQLLLAGDRPEPFPT